MAKAEDWMRIGGGWRDGWWMVEGNLGVRLADGLEIYSTERDGLIRTDGGVAEGSSRSQGVQGRRVQGRRSQSGSQRARKIMEG